MVMPGRCQKCFAVWKEDFIIIKPDVWCMMNYWLCPTCYGELYGEEQLKKIRTNEKRSI